MFDFNEFVKEMAKSYQEEESPHRTNAQRTFPKDIPLTDTLPLKDDFEVITVEYEDINDHLRRVAFNGRWLVQDKREDVDCRDAGTLYSVAYTSKGQLFFLYETPKRGSGYKVFLSFEEMVASGGVPPGIASQVAVAIGEDFVEFLDI